MRRAAYTSSIGRTLRIAGLLLIASSCLSCASLFRMGGSACGEESRLDVRHLHSQKRSDCLVTCVNMVLQYYKVPEAIPDTSLPVELISLSRHLNAQAATDGDGNKVFAAVLQLPEERLMEQLEKGRPLILIYKPSARDVYHSVVLSGYCPQRDKYYVNDPVRRKAQWKSLSKIPTFSDSGKHLVLLVGLERA